VLAHVARLATPASIYIGVDDEPADRRAVVEWMAQRLGVATPPATAGGAPSPARGKRCSNRALRASGYRFRFPTFREGYADVLSNN
jgi:hypothetical protein